MRITLAQWRDNFGDDSRIEDIGCGCRVTERPGDIAFVSLCSYHEGFVVGFDAARGGG